MITLEFTDAATMEQQAVQAGLTPVSYTHLDVYKRQHLGDANLVVNAWFVADDDSNPHVPFNGMFPDWQFFNVSKVHGMPNAPIKAH